MWIIFAVCQLFLHSLVNAFDTKLIIFCKSADGKEIKVVGELLAVRDSALVLRTEPVNDSTGMSNVTSKQVCLVPLGRIDSLIVRRSSVILSSATSGLAIGGGLGAAMGFVSGVDDPHHGGFSFEFSRAEAATMGFAIGGGIGLTLGLIGGIATPAGDELVDLNSKDDIEMLKRIARYQRGEPEELKKAPSCNPQ